MTLDAPSLSDAEIRKLVERLDRPIVLVGMMGVGKSTVGRKLATLLHLDFRDADDEIEEAAQMTVSEIFERFGEDDFRGGERRVIARLLDGGPQVLATGGGAVMDADTRALIKTRGVSVWLKADLEVLLRRTKRRAERPLASKIETLLPEREPFYALSDLIVQSREEPHDSVVEELIVALNGKLGVLEQKP